MPRPQPSGSLALVLLVTVALVPPVGLVLWIALAGATRPEYLRSRTVRAGLALLAIGASPVGLTLGLWSVGLGETATPRGALLAAAFLGIVVGSIVLGVGIVGVRTWDAAPESAPRRPRRPLRPPRPPHLGRPWRELAAYLHPLLRVGAGIAGASLLVSGVVLLVRRVHGGGAGLLLLGGAVAFGFALSGRLPWWWRE